MNLTHISANQVPAVLLNAFGKRYRTYKVEVTTEVRLTGLYWDGGSCSEYVLVNLATGERSSPEGAVLNPPQFGGPSETPKVVIPAGCVLAKHRIFCGKDLGVTFYARAEDIAPLLPAPSETLPAHLTTVLRIIRSYIPRARRDEAHRSGINAAAYDAAIDELKARGLVNKQGALTLAGKNAAQAAGRA